MSDCTMPDPAVPTEIADLDGDGYAESTLIDTNTDGQVDTILSDLDGDGVADLAQFDNNPDGTFVADVIAADADGDGAADVVFDDLDYDGTFDTATRGTGVPLADANPYSVSAADAPFDSSGQS